MFLGIIFSSNDYFGFDKFHFSGFIGYIVLALYYFFIFKYKEKKVHDFKFSIYILIVYLFIVLLMTIKLRCNITTFNLLWFIPFLLCIIVETFIYFIKNGKSSDKNEKDNNNDPV